MSDSDSDTSSYVPSVQSQETPLLIAVHVGNLDLIVALLNHGADVNATSPVRPMGWYTLTGCVIAVSFLVVSRPVSVL